MRLIVLFLFFVLLPGCVTSPDYEEEPDHVCFDEYGSRFSEVYYGIQYMEYPIGRYSEHNGTVIKLSCYHEDLMVVKNKRGDAK